jgi:Domain of unknown function (DUF4190)
MTMSYQDPYQPGYGQQPGYEQSGYPQQPYSGGPSYPTTPAPGYQPGYQQPSYQPVGYVQPAYAAPASATTNTMAILALVFAFVFAPLAIVFGHVAKKQIRERGEGGEGLATAGLVCGYIFTSFYLIACVFYIIVVIIAVGASNSSSDYDYVIRTVGDLIQLAR